VNPLAAILSASMLLDHLGLIDEAHRVERAVAAVLVEQKVRTADLGGSSSTREATDAVIEKLPAR
jgi:isocitrate/isopropylmalate dehydrogenase